MMHRFFSMLLAIEVLVAAGPSNDEIRKILVERIDTRKQAVGIVVGIVEPEGRRIIAYGSAAKGGSKAIDGDTLFEIGSITKVFTAQILAEAVAHGVVKLDDPVAKLLPSSVKMPGRGGRAITLLDLTTHRSGLPRLPGNLTSTDLSNPYAAYTVAQLYEFLTGHTLRRDPGAEFEYSNLGVGLLGHALALQAEMDYESLVRAKVLGPLGMKSTAITLTPALKARMSQGHNAKLEPVPNWDLPALAGAGALRSSANDMLNFVAAHAGLGKSVPDPVMASMLATRRPAIGGAEIGLGWMIAKSGSAEIVSHGGGTGGFQSFVGFDPKARVGVVVLSNTQGMPGIEDIGRHLLDSNFPLTPPRKERQQISFDPKGFDVYVGNYQLAPRFVLAVTREGDRFFTQATGQPRIEVFAMSERVFFPKVMDAELEFTVDDSGRANKVTLRQNGVVVNGARVDGPLPDAPAERKAIIVDPKLLEQYVGKYQLGQGFAITVTRDEGRLFAQATGQGKAEIFAETESKFFFRVVDAQITFSPGLNGRTEKLTLHQGGLNAEGKRVE
ncbi:MAG: serine hydrolase [Bryobacteraceae bacterium]|nr:serine hydrolase [Bryobacteraceae bacterium]